MWIACEQNVWLDNERFDKIHSPFLKDGYYEQDVVCQWKIRKPLRQVTMVTRTGFCVSRTRVSLWESRIIHHIGIYVNYFYVSITIIMMTSIDN